MADFDSTSYLQRRNLDDFPAKYHPTSEFFSKLTSYLRIFGQKVCPALEFSGKKFTQENGTSPNTPTLQVPPETADF